MNKHYFEESTDKFEKYPLEISETATCPEEHNTLAKYDTRYTVASAIATTELKLQSQSGVLKTLENMVEYKHMFPDYLKNKNSTFYFAKTRSIVPWKLECEHEITRAKLVDFYEENPVTDMTDDLNFCFNVTVLMFFFTIIMMLGVLYVTTKEGIEES